MSKRHQTLSDRFEALSTSVTRWTGSSAAFATALGIVLVWALLGPVFDYSDTWQLVINTGTTVVTFLMVFLIQRSQNKDAQAVHLKLNEMVAALEGASNRLVDVEDLSEEELGALHAFYAHLSAMAKRDAHITASHSIDEAKALHRHKQKRRRSSRRAAAPPRRAVRGTESDPVGDPRP